MTAADPLEQLRAAGERLAAADEERAAALKEIGEVMRAAKDEVSVSELARLAGVSRVTAYRLLEP